jgi:UDP-3-O-[3-hydroxymyristoyl] glucosamine N-acyltransferase
MSRTYTVGQLADLVGGTVRGDPNGAIRGVADVSEAGPDQATWVNREGYAEKLAASRAGAVLVPTNFGETPMPAILCAKIEPSVAKLLGAFATPISKPDPGIHPTAVVHPGARIGGDPSIGPHVVIDAEVRIGASCVIHAGVFIGRGTTIGDGCFLWPNVVIRDGCAIGHRVIIHPNSVIGADGFGYYFDQGRHNKVPHIGGVILEDDVEIGACTCVDRSKFGNTVVGTGTKIDNQVQIAHNVRIGRHCVLAGQTGIAGSVRIGDDCVFGGRAVSLDNVAVGDRVTVAGLAVVDKDVPDGLTVSGFPARDHREELRERALVRRLPKLAEQLKDLIHRVEQLEASTHHHP